MQPLSDSRPRPGSASRRTPLIQLWSVAARAANSPQRQPEARDCSTPLSRLTERHVWSVKKDSDDRAAQSLKPPCQPTSSNQPAFPVRRAQDSIPGFRFLYLVSQHLARETSPQNCLAAAPLAQGPIRSIPCLLLSVERNRRTTPQPRLIALHSRVTERPSNPPTNNSQANPVEPTWKGCLMKVPSPCLKRREPNISMPSALSTQYLVLALSSAFAGIPSIFSKKPDHSAPPNPRPGTPARPLPRVFSTFQKSYKKASFGRP